MRRGESHPDSALSITSAAVQTRHHRSHRRYYFDRAGNARGTTPPVVTSEEFRLPLPSDVCAVCTRESEFLFQTPRIALCKTCVDEIRECCGGEVGRIQQKVLNFLRSEWPFVPPLTHLAIALDARLGRDENGRSRDADLDDCMNDCRLENWRLCLRAYHLGLTATWPPEFRPDDEVWMPLAHRIRVQDTMHCNACGCANKALHVHHIVPLSEGGTNDPRNLVTLCHDCHLAQHPGGSFSQPDPSAADSDQ